MKNSAWHRNYDQLGLFVNFGITGGENFLFTIIIYKEKIGKVIFALEREKKLAIYLVLAAIAVSFEYGKLYHDKPISQNHSQRFMILAVWHRSNKYSLTRTRFSIFARAVDLCHSLSLH